MSIWPLKIQIYNIAYILEFNHHMLVVLPLKIDFCVIPHGMIEASKRHKTLILSHSAFQLQNFEHLGIKTFKYNYLVISTSHLMDSRYPRMDLNIGFWIQISVHS